MTPVQKTLLFRITFGLPLSWVGISVTALCITWYHGYGFYFLYLVVPILLAAIPFVIIQYKNFYIFSIITLLIAMLFNIFSLILLFFPQWNGWNGWNEDGQWAHIYFQIPDDFSYWTLFLFLGIFIFFALKKFLEIDFEKMMCEALKDKMVDKVEGKIFVNKAMCVIANLSFNVKFLAKTESWLYTAGFILLCIVVLPLKDLGSSATRFGNNFFIATFFFVVSYLLIWLCYWIAMTSYAQYRLINKLEKELGIPLKPALK